MGKKGLKKKFKNGVGLSKNRELYTPLDISRKVEYKIEVLIPPNISDPLNLNEDDSGMSRLID